MKASISRWGNSQGIRLPKNILDAVSMKEGEQVTIEAVDGKIVISPSKKMNSLDELFEEYDGTYECSETQWGAPLGKEVW